jgi:small subunit ribosomal protein S5
MRFFYSTLKLAAPPPLPMPTDAKLSNKLTQRVLLIRKVARVTSGGKVRSTSALVIVGNQNGSAGYGIGRGADVLLAVEKATINAKKAMTWFPRFDNRTIYSDEKVKFHGTMFDMHTTVPGNLYLIDFRIWYRR